MHAMLGAATWQWTARLMINLESVCMFTCMEAQKQPALQAAAAATSHKVQELQDKLAKAQDDNAALHAKVLGSHIPLLSTNPPLACLGQPPRSALSCPPFCRPTCCYMRALFELHAQQRSRYSAGN